MTPVVNQPYFVPHNPGTSVSVRDAGDAGVDVEEIPGSVDPDDFAPKLLNFVDESEMTPLERVESIMRATPRVESGKKPTVDQGTSSDQPKDSGLYAAVGKAFRPTKKREVKFSALEESAKKAAPKLFFAGERTYLQWMHTGILLAGISMALGSHTESGSVMDWVSVFLLPVAIGIIVYAMSQFSKRTYMIASRSPGPYEDRWGPVVVGTIFSLALVAQFCVILGHR